MQIFVQFSNETESTIIGVFGCPQPPEAAPYQGAVDENDARYKAFYDSAIEADQQYLPKPA